MSGPKTSDYYLTAEQRAALLEQARLRREELLKEQKAKKECAKIEENKKVLRSEVLKIDKAIKRIEQIQLESGNKTEFFQEIKLLRDEAMKKINVAGTLSYKSELEVLQNENRDLKKFTLMIQNKEPKTTSILEELNVRFRKESSSKISEGFMMSFDSFEERMDEQERGLADRIQATLSSIDLELCSIGLKNRFKEIQNIVVSIKEYDYLKNYYAMTIIPFEKEYEEYKQIYLKHGEEFEELITQYHLLAEEAGVLPIDIQFAGSAVSELKSMIKELEEQIAYKTEQAYISECLDEAMQEMGYQMVGTRSVTKKSGRTFKNELYLFDEGTVVNVTYSGEGQITMELGGIDIEDRIPTENECRNLADDMRAFCDDYYEIERRLRKKGVVTKKISILPPDEEYAQIINISDYNVLTKLEKYEEHRDRKQSVSQKRLHKEG